MKNTADIDLGLDVLNTVRLPGEQLSRSDIAHVCGCTRQNIEQIEMRALKKIRLRLRQELGLDYGTFTNLGSHGL